MAKTKTRSLQTVVHNKESFHLPEVRLTLKMFLVTTQAEGDISWVKVMDAAEYPTANKTKKYWSPNVTGVKIKKLDPRLLNNPWRTY